ncbi:flagellar basal body-associated FliL family protein [Ferrimonas marina]|uniref:Flagellar protein FliL n=1 Tax=Ferrimonas marina TaxID=299255 RepID=A0A1M5QTI7_9GAMM|nr:flagellar basal body-associated FliL family protein [Ferrimonas marina]SHH17447.1 flagellar FliL protein [Ferrimonas marina]
MNANGNLRPTFLRNSLVLILACLISYWGGTQTADYWQEQPTQGHLMDQAKFHTLERFVISVPGDKFQHYVQLELALKSRTSNFDVVLEEAEPLVRNALMHLFSNKTYEELSQLRDLGGLQNEVKQALSQTLAANRYTAELDEVLFTRLVVQ